MGQKSVAYNPSGVITGFYDSVDSPVPEGISSIGITDEEWQDCLSSPGWKVENGVLVAPVPLTASQIEAERTSAAWTAYQAAAQVALDKSDVTILRCYEGGVAVPAAWSTYRKALRTIISAASGDATQPIPSRPEYPAGT